MRNTKIKILVSWKHVLSTWQFKCKMAMKYKVILLVFFLR